MRNALLKIGLTGNEADIYLALLELGPSLVSGIVDKTGINRTNVYDRLNRLKDKGLVSYLIKSGKKHFVAAKPERILLYLKEKEEAIAKEYDEINRILPQLKSICPERDDELVEMYEGKEGLKTILEDVLKTEKTVLTYGSEGNFTQILKFYFKHYLNRLEKKGIRMKVIFNAGETREPFSWKLAQVRYVPERYKTPTETTIYGDRVAIFLLTKKPKAILITSKSVAGAYRKYFDLLWKSAIST